MDFSKVFKVLNYVVMAFGILYVVIALIVEVMLGALTADTDATVQGGLTLLGLIAMLPAILEGVIGIFAGRAGLNSDPDRCKKLSIILAVLSVLSLISSIRAGSVGFLDIISVALYGFYCYLAHTESY